ncbi:MULTISPECIES: bifunctional phosphoribosyl-AMP cyclohydrolase/phosphoribosyl-ATP diphosphatase HisIE [Asticcacaulis]|uniref:bifunctional phosphoribosyl-AMP cyclohydrolase/phosphoribosyl-ATP diphosphatase HisIE n=1 Tax=Asticcacaulis TaxID=76890 RepID=UPI001AE3BA2F|nr:MULTISPECIES: bifunctional phosphoribosyl-AMP cyclohydrolase/phosphoribosyl-ATP diphosphatase HisIE [Asticcacaulis]MBP2160887.1 phosphoribosyl-ATP pyrophosphohydrolase/phosphoribosyl-AMP cyclohydrolase [Asticcacaulis solisilvae]MDR6801909.1 phosphoribosyl-ATP pyrophosphohydrolase/phosphoribosyl-AMP cyclohydrolase [Asticcacaulis sp. BE141]
MPDAHILPDPLTIADIAKIDFAKEGGLVPAVVQHADTLQVLMLGYMNAEALTQTLNSGLVTFFSRSKSRLWTKGETSGDTLQLDRILTDCDEDALLVYARPQGPTCHTKTTSCFGHEDAPGIGFLGHLAAIVKDRAAADPADSYTARLMHKGIAKIAQKVGEEGLETALAGRAGDLDELHNEAADLLYHLSVLLMARDTSLEAVLDVLRERHKG